ncbi:MAG TPA: PilZ domain-containing protein [Myxococcales bacterium]|nr:PilZ domain-containing protein [Myxococcales bacterium]
MDAKKAVLLRHRFDDVEQLRRHLHEVDGSTLLFFRDPRLNVATGGSALVEIAFESNEQTRVLRTTVLARAEGQGVWLAVPNTRFVRDVRERGLMQRKGRRLGVDEMVRVRIAHAEYFVKLLDISMGGARIGGGLPPHVARGSPVQLTLPAPESGRAPEITRGKIAWVEDGEAGVTFDRDVESSRVAAGRLFRSLEPPWAKAREIRHLPTCCKGEVLDPPLPRVRIDGKDTKRAG